MSAQSLVLTYIASAPYYAIPVEYSCSRSMCIECIMLDNVHIDRGFEVYDKVVCWALYLQPLRAFFKYHGIGYHISHWKIKN